MKYSQNNDNMSIARSNQSLLKNESKESGKPEKKLFNLVRGKITHQRTKTLTSSTDLSKDCFKITSRQPSQEKLNIKSTDTTVQVKKIPITRDFVEIAQKQRMYNFFMNTYVENMKNEFGLNETMERLIAKRK